MKKEQDSDIFGAEMQVDVSAGQSGGAQITVSQLSIASLPSAQLGSADMTSVMQSIAWGPLSKFDSQLAALQLSYSPMASAAARFISTVQQYSGAITADGQYVVIDATARDGSGAALLDQLETLGLVGGASFGSMA